MRASDKNLTVLSEAERVALYGLPDFDDFQRAEYFALTNGYSGPNRPLIPGQIVH